MLHLNFIQSVLYFIASESASVDVCNIYAYILIYLYKN